jgi:hypothetical protein
MSLTYSQPINPRVGTNRVNNRVFKGDVLGRSIQMYRMWFLFLRLSLDCEDNDIHIIDHVKNKKIKVKVNKKFYKKWDLDRVKEDRFDDWWKDKKHLFIETEPTLVNEVEDDLIKPTKSFTSEFVIQNQHKYIPTHMKYNIFVWKNLGNTRKEIIDLLGGYRFYDVRIPQNESSVRRSLRSSERLILMTSKGLF